MVEMRRFHSLPLGAARSTAFNTAAVDPPGASSTGKSIHGDELILAELRWGNGPPLRPVGGGSSKAGTLNRGGVMLLHSDSEQINDLGLTRGIIHER
jgi:hypothetical protein